MKIYWENLSVENLYFSQSESEAKILCCWRRKFSLSNLSPTEKNSTMTNK
ncbi:MAG: hypothetical protein AAGJ08_06925 [Cyanobacteria bacterium P01_H01_bin.35]